MMYILFLGLLYKLQGGRFRSFVRAVLGYDVEADRTPTSAPVSAARGGTMATREPAAKGYLSDGAASDGAASDGGGASDGPDFGTLTKTTDATAGDKSRALAALGLSNSRGGGTFSGSYERIPSWGGGGGGDEEMGGGGGRDGCGGNGEGVPRSISVNSDGGGAGARSLSVNSDTPQPATDLTPAIKRALKPAGGGTVVVGDGSGGGGGGGVGGKAGQVAYAWSLSIEDRRVLKRRTILARITPIVLLSSFVGDLDLITDWCFLRYGLVGQGYIICQFALFFAIVGTVMWALAVTEFSLMSKLKTMWKGNPLSRLQHVGLGWQLLSNVICEDLPQFVITVITRPTSVTGVLNLCASGLSLCAKVVHGWSSQRAASLATQFKMIDQDPAVTRNLFRLRDEAKRKASAAEKLVYLAWTNRCSTGEKKAAAVFQVLQLDPTFVNGDLEYMKADLLSGFRLYITSCALTGHIPPQLGGFKILQSIVLSGNQLSGPIPAELGKLINLRELNLSANALSGPIPVELAQLGSLVVLNLSSNALTGPIPAELSGLQMLTSLILSKNQLTGTIPRGLSKLAALQELDLSSNQLTGTIPKVFGERLGNLQSFSAGNNMLTGRVPLSLGMLARMTSLVVANNRLTAAKEAEEQLKRSLHPECQTDFLPQEETKEEPAEEPQEEHEQGGLLTKECVV